MKDKVIIFGPETEYEKSIVLKRPKGKRARQMMPQVLAFMQQLQEKTTTDGDQDLQTILLMIDAFWGQDEFEEVLVPYVLGLEDEEGRKFLEENGTMIDVIDAFTEASEYLIENSFSRKEVQEALGKSKEEVKES